MENVPKREEEYEKSCVEEPSDASRKNEGKGKRIVEEHIDESLEKEAWLKLGVKGAEPILQSLSSIETELNCLSGTTEQTKVKVEQSLLFYIKRFQSSGGRHGIRLADRFRGEYKTISMEYLCLLQGGKERSYIDLMEKLLRLRKQLVEQEDEYGDILKGKCSKDKEDVLRGLVITRRELEHEEKVYLISRIRYDHSQLEHAKVDDEIFKYSDEDFLTNMISGKKEMMELEGEYVGLLLAGATYNADMLSRYSPNVLRRAVTWKRDSLVMDELDSIEHFGERFRQIDIESVTEVRRLMIYMRLDYHWCGWQEMYPNLDEDINIDGKISRLERMVNLRQKYLKLEDEYLWVLRERYTLFDVHQIHLEYFWENVLQISLCWRNDSMLLLLETYTPKLQESLGNDMEKWEKWKEAEREYCEFIKKRHLTNLDSISLMDVTQVYAKYNHPELLKDINSLKVKMKKLERDCYYMVQRVFDPREEYACKRIVIARTEVEKIEDKYFNRLKHNIAEKNFVQPPLSTKAGEAVPHQECLAIVIPRDEQSTRARRWEIRRLVVLGGLMESITSLVIVTAAMSANISDGNIVALALTNLIAGLFIIRHDVSRLQKKSRIKEFTRIEVDGNNFKEVVKETMHCVLYFIIAFLSFLFFGLVPPLVYALSSLKIRNKNLKIITAAGTSLSCTAFLAVLKAHIIQKPRNRLVYVKTAAIYVSGGVGAFGISYLAGYMFGQLAEKLPWDL